jgi:FkbM family methyltransferase
MKLREKLAKLLRQPQPARFLLSRLLWHSKLCRLFTINCEPYRLRFYPTAYSATLWLSPRERLTDEQFLQGLLQSGDVFIDVGANIGTLTLTASKIVGAHGKVYSIEAHPQTYEYLLGNLRLNHVQNVTTFNVACGGDNGTANLTSKAADDQNVISQAGLRIPMRRLDDLIVDGESQTIAVLKIDVEGYEKFVLEGATQLLSRVNFVYFESWDEHFERFHYKLSDVVAFLGRFGFEVYSLAGNKVDHDYNSPICENLLAKNVTRFAARQA